MNAIVRAMCMAEGMGSRSSDPWTKIGNNSKVPSL